jgi:hypothetical protein
MLGNRGNEKWIPASATIRTTGHRIFFLNWLQRSQTELSLKWSNAYVQHWSATHGTWSVIWLVYGW